MLEEVKSTTEIQHPVVRKVLEQYGTKDDTGYEVIYNADLPSKSGLGSSSAFTVSLLHAFFGNQGRLTSKAILAREAINVEQNLLHETVGCQDQIAAAYGGLNRIDFFPGGDFRVTPVCISQVRRTELESNLMLFFTGFTRLAETIERKKVAQFKDKTAELRAMYDMVDEAEQILLDQSRNLTEFGALLHEGWIKKRSLDEAVSNSSIDASYQAARSAGAIGGKLLGAGGGGFLLLYVPPEKQAAVRAALTGLPFVPVKMERDGTNVVLYNPDLTSNYRNSHAQVS